MAEAEWTAVGLSRDLEPGAAIGVVVEGREWALWRGRSGRAHLWEDRCPHAGMKVSLGFVRGDKLGCLFHGWQFDESGQCTRIPTAPDLTPPDTLRLRGLPVVESGGMIWACFAEVVPPPPALTAALPARSVAFDAPLRVMLAALGPAERVAHARDAFVVQSDGERWLVAGQSAEAGRCVLHVCALGGGAEAARRASRWALRLRQECLEPA